MSGVGRRTAAFVTQGGSAASPSPATRSTRCAPGRTSTRTGRGTIAGNTVYDTKGDFLIDNANFTFRGNRSG